MPWSPVLSRLIRGKPLGMPSLLVIALLLARCRHVGTARNRRQLNDYGQSIENTSNKGKAGGEGGIRTLEAGHPA